MKKDRSEPGVRMPWWRMVLLTLVPVGALGCGSMVSQPDAEFGRPASRAELDTGAVARAAIDAREIRRAIDFLASEATGGADGSGAGLERMASWIAERYHESGLEPGGDHGGYLQFWRGDTGDSTVAVPNVVGILSGAEVQRAQQHVIMTAHLDHPGTGGSNDADYRVSGIAALVSVAQAFAALPSPPARPVLFLVTSGGEQESGGASWFADHAPVFLSHAVAVISLDRVGHPDADGVVVRGHDYSTLGPLLERVAARDPELALDVRPAGGPDLFRSSGPYPLARRGIPAVVLTQSPEIGSTSVAEPSQELDAERVARIARLAFLAAHELATMGGRPEWTARGRRVLSP